MLSLARLAPVALAVSVFACKGPPTPAQDPELPPEVPLAERPPDLSLGDSYAMGRPVVDGRVALVPVYAIKPPALSFVTLTDGMKRGDVVVIERGGGYDAVEVINNSAEQVFAMSGELIIDAHQDRALAENTIIPPNERKVVAVRCVEASRSSGATSEFNPLDAIAEPSIRRRLRFKDQSEVWSQIDAINRRLGLSPPTRTYRYAAMKQTEGAAKARRDKLVDALARVPDRDRMVGLGLAIDGRMVALDRFATPSLYRIIEPRLVASYLPAEDELPVQDARELRPSDVQRFAHPQLESRTDAGSEFLLPLETYDSDRD